MERVSLICEEIASYKSGTTDVLYYYYDIYSILYIENGIHRAVLLQTATTVVYLQIIDTIARKKGLYYMDEIRLSRVDEK